MTTTVVFLPGVNNVASLWRPVVEAIGADIEPILQDLPALESVEAIAEQLHGQLPERFVLVGHSFGGMVALAMLEAYPESVEAIALVASRAGADTEELAAAKIERAASARVDGHEEFVLANGARVFHPDYRDNPEIMAQRAHDVRAYGTDRYVAHNIAMAHRPDRTEVLAASGIPKLVVAPGDDLVITSAYQTELASKAGAELVVIESTGHMLPAEDPTGLGQALDAWLRSIRND
jgi:pimeloyl-ACP methyl ester carboxylesterase